MSVQQPQVRVKFERKDNITIARFEAHEISSLDRIDEPLEQFKREIEAGRPEHLLIDFEGIEFVATTAINMLLVILKRVRTYGGDVYLCCLSPAVRRVFDVMQLAELFEIYPDRQAALTKLGVAE